MAVTSRQTAALAIALLLGVGIGWFARGKRDAAPPDGSPDRAAAGERADEAPLAPVGAPRTHDDELRQILIDPKGHALAARVRNASAVNGQCEVEVDTTVGWFRVACGIGDTPSVGEKFEVLGRVSPDGQIDGAPPLLRPSWLEPVGTIARLRGQ